jgi:hypothetical protein
MRSRPIIMQWFHVYRLSYTLSVLDIHECHYTPRLTPESEAACSAKELSDSDAEVG